jgi:glucose-6-phosphate-specific signal transduction histidine kinase
MEGDEGTGVARGGAIRGAGISGREERIAGGVGSLGRASQ